MSTDWDAEVLGNIMGHLPSDVQEKVRETGREVLSTPPSYELMVLLFALENEFAGTGIDRSLQRRLPAEQASAISTWFHTILYSAIHEISKVQPVEYSVLQRSLLLSLMDWAFSMGHDYVLLQGRLLAPLGDVAESVPIYEEQPASWSNPELLGQPIELNTTVQRAIVFHGAMVLALKHPDASQLTTAWIIEDMVDHLEGMFEDLGLERPQHGWRGELLQN